MAICAVIYAHDADAGELLPVAVLSVHDGDTLTINLPCDIREVCQKMPIRLNGIDAPELKDKRPEIRQLARVARLKMQDLTSVAHKVEMQIIGRDKYFRLDADLYSDGISVAETLKSEGLARVYTGSGPKPW